jgi:hypothetical protein
MFSLVPQNSLSRIFKRSNVKPKWNGNLLGKELIRIKSSPSEFLAKIKIIGMRLNFLKTSKLEGKTKLKQNILGGGATFKRTAFS